MPRAAISSEEGFSAVELLIALMLLLIVVGLPMTWFIVTVNQQNRAVSRSWSATQAELGLERLTRDLRQACTSSSCTGNPTTTFTWSSTSASVTLTTSTAGGSTTAVTWSCSFPTTSTTGSCTRQAGSGTGVTEISNVKQLAFVPTDSSGNSLSSPTTQAIYVGINLSVYNISALDKTSTNAISTTPIFFSDGVDLRNGSLG